VGNPYLAFLSAGGNGGNERARIFGYADGGTYGGGLEIQTRDSANIFQNRMVIDSSGRVGIGTDSPVKKLTVRHDAADGLRIEYSGNSDNMMIDASTISAFSDTTPSNLKLNPDGGNVGIGTTSPSEKLTVNGNIESLDTFVLKNSGGHKYQQIFQNTNDFVIRYNNSSSWFERMRIESDGGIFFPALGGFSVSNSDVRYNATSDELYYQTSSKRYKSEITDLENSLDKVNNLRPVRFKDNLSQEYATGMIAEEVAEIIPEVVFTKPIDGFDEPQIEGINYSDIVPFLIKSIQELKAEIDILKTQIN
jgi:hypothetical protein